MAENFIKYFTKSCVIHLPAEMDCGIKPYLKRELDTSRSAHGQWCLEILGPVGIPL